MHDTVVDRRPGEPGFALILAILSLMLLTFLGLTLATTTSTDEVAAVHSHTPPSADSRSAATDAMIRTGRRRVFTGPNAAGA